MHQCFLSRAVAPVLLLVLLPCCTPPALQQPAAPKPPAHLVLLLLQLLILALMHSASTHSATSLVQVLYTHPGTVVQAPVSYTLTPALLHQQKAAPLLLETCCLRSSQVAAALLASSLPPMQLQAQGWSAALQLLGPQAQLHTSREWFAASKTDSAAAEAAFILCHGCLHINCSGCCRQG
jgi:hypothetical protein